ncbi:MAG: four helix bundle protein [Bacteroidota bacterium]
MDLEVYRLAHKLAMDIFWISARFPVEERYSLTDQIRRSSRSVAANIAEGWGKRKYPLSFKKQLVDANGSLEETKSWLMFARDCKYISIEQFDALFTEYETLGGKLWRLEERWK